MWSDGSPGLERGPGRKRSKDQRKPPRGGRKRRDAVWTPTMDRWPSMKGKKVLTDCCARRVPAEETISTVTTSDRHDPKAIFKCPSNAGCYRRR